MKMIILNTAAYDNWKPTSQSQYGLMHSSNNADKASALNMDDFLEKESPRTIQVNITAERRTDGCAPANKLNNHKPVRIKIGRNHFTFLFCNGFRNHVRSQ